jgi:glycosyltransferase involved in cell wall biosynthesis
LGTTTEGNAMKQALIFNPYFDTLGGGERYTTGVIAALNQQGYQVVIAWKDASLLQQLRDRFNISLTASIDPEGYTTVVQGNLWQKMMYESRFDYIFWVSDGSLPFLFGKKNVVHFQVPFNHIVLPRITSVKKKCIRQIICNSQFTKQVIDRTFSVASDVIYPPCGQMKSEKKEKIILGVGRFDKTLHSKRQDILIEAFQKLNRPDWKLVLAGGTIHQNETLSHLRTAAKQASIEIVINPSFDQIQTLYGKASLFWHAAGYGIDEIKEPELVEHFGIVTVEAMSAGAVPLTYDAGGQREIIRSGENGFLWHSINELVEKSKQIMDDEDLRQQLALKARSTSSQFSLEQFIYAFTHTSIC